MGWLVCIAASTTINYLGIVADRTRSKKNFPRIILERIDRTCLRAYNLPRLNDRGLQSTNTQRII